MGENTPEREKAIGLWKEGSREWVEGNYGQAEQYLRLSVKADPNYFNAQLSLGIILFLHRGKN